MNELSIEEIEKIFSDESKIEDFISNLDEKKFTDFLLTLHSKFMKIKKYDDKIYDDYVGVGAMRGSIISLVAPSIELKNKILPNIIDSLKQIKNNMDRGILLHYLIIEIHFFSDGNGRLARSILELFCNKNFDLDNKLFYHKTREQNESSGNAAFELEKKYGIKQTDRILSYTSYILSKILFEKQLIDNKIDIRKFNSASCGYSSELNDEIIIRDNTLSEKEKEKVCIALRDSSGCIGLGALTILIMQKLKNIEAPNSSYDERYIIGFDLGDSNLFEGWTTSDYYMAIKIHEKLQEIQLNVLLDIFGKPDNFKIGDITLKQCFNDDLNKEPRILNEIFNLAQSMVLDLESTRSNKIADMLVQIVRTYEVMKDEPDFILLGGGKDNSKYR